MKKFFISTTLFTGLGRSLGMFIPFFIAHFYGVGSHTDAFFLAFGVVNFILSVFVQLFESAIVPYLAEQKQKGQSMWAFATKVLLQMLPWIAGLCVLIWLVMPYGFKKEMSAGEITTAFLYLIPFLLISVWSSALNGIFFSEKMFWLPSVSPVLRSATVLACIVFLHGKLGIHAVSLGFVAGELIRWTASLAVLKKHALITKNTAGADLGTHHFVRDAIVQIAGLSAMNVIYFVDLVFASRLGTGSVSLLNYADRMLQVPYLLFQGGVLQVFHSFWSENYQQQPTTQVSQNIQKNITLVFSIAGFFAVLVWLLGPFIVGFVYGHGELSKDQIHTVTSLFGILVVGFPFALVYLLYIRFLFIMRWANIYLIAALAHLAFKALLNAALIPSFHIRGIAWATSVMYALMAAGFFLYSKAKTKA